ncbi:copper homeostasis CutC domain-containing protein [Podospora conica]|nr:copper homeostasis CutC domain-containing protein [Schizothecium conicum]
MLEIPIFGPDDGAAAVLAGAQRLELNRAGSYAVGGLTPTLPELTALLASLSTPRPPIRIMIRPRGAPPGDQQRPDFLYTPFELRAMHASITEFVHSNLLSPSLGDGFVFGVLSQDGSGGVGIDVQACTALVRSAAGWACVLHRAFDDVLAAGEGVVGGEQVGVVRGCGFRGVLTSGGRGDAMGNVGVLGRVVREGREVGVEVVVGGGVRAGDVRGLGEGAGLEEGRGGGVWFHSSCLVGEGEGKRFDVGEVGRLREEIRRVLG